MNLLLISGCIDPYKRKNSNLITHSPPAPPFFSYPQKIPKGEYFPLGISPWSFYDFSDSKNTKIPA
jgi:hypothetical protein